MNKFFGRIFMRTPKWLVPILSMAIAASAFGQEPSASDSNQSNQQLQKRIDELEMKVRQLEQNQTALPPAPQPAAEQAPVHTVNDRLRLNVFGDVGFETTDLKPSANTFEIGSLDLFMTAHLSEKVSALAEVLFVSESDNSITPDVERRCCSTGTMTT